MVAALTIPRLVAGPGAAYLNPSDFASLGVFNPTTNVTVDATTGKMTGGATFSGVARTQAGTKLWVFTFSDFVLTSGVSITCVNPGTNSSQLTSSAVAFLSLGNMQINGVIDGTGHDGSYLPLHPFIAGGPGGFASDQGPGAGGNGSGGGFGGAGGAVTNHVTIANTYNPDISAQLIGGSGGGDGSGVMVISRGGGGGGAIQLGALGTVTLGGTIVARGGMGLRGLGGPFPNGGDIGELTGGGGSGGAVLIHASNIQWAVGGSISVRGGNSGPANPNNSYFARNQLVLSPDTSGGGGGGGRILVAYKTAIAGTPNVDVSGGTTSLAYITTNGMGGAGSFTVVQDASVPAPIPPTILRGPQSQTNMIGTSVTFTVNATGTDLHFTWRKDSKVVATDSPTLAIPAVTPADGGSYTVVVSNIAGTIESQPATLTIAARAISAFLEVNGLTGFQIHVSNPVNSPGLVFETATQLSSRTVWTTVPGGSSSITLPPTNAAGFFRLHAQ
jgi:hypothetical protein